MSHTTDLETVRALREQRHVGVWATADAGPHVKALCTVDDEPTVREALAQTPGAVAKDVWARRLQQAPVEGGEVLVERLVGAAAQEDGQPDLPALELPLVEQPCPGKREDRDGGRAPLLERLGHFRRHVVLIVLRENFLGDELTAARELHGRGLLEDTVRVAGRVEFLPSCWLSYVRAQALLGWVLGLELGRFQEGVASYRRGLGVDVPDQRSSSLLC